MMTQPKLPTCQPLNAKMAHAARLRDAEVATVLGLDVDIIPVGVDR